MTQTAHAPPATRVSARWCLLPVTLWILSLGVAALAGLALYRAVSPDPAPIDPGDRVRITSSGMRLLQEVDATAQCRLERDGRSFDISGGQTVVSTGGLELFVVGQSPGEAGAGTYTLACEGQPEGLYAARAGSVPLGLLLGGGSILLFLAAIGTWVWTFVRRRRATGTTG